MTVPCCGCSAQLAVPNSAECAVALCPTCRKRLAPTVLCGQCSRPLSAALPGGTARGGAICFSCQRALEELARLKIRWPYDSTQPSGLQDLYYGAVERAIHAAVGRVVQAVERLRSQSLRLPVKPHSSRTFAFPSGVAWTIDLQSFAVSATHLENANHLALADRIWRKPREVLAALRTLEVARAWVERVADACRRERQARLRDPAVAKVVEQIVGAAAVAAIEQEEEERS